MIYFRLENDGFRDFGIQQAKKLQSGGVAIGPVMMILTAAAALRCQLIAADANAGSMPALP